MSNRLLSFLILFVIFWTLIWWYLYLFVYYTWSLVLTWNQANFKVSLYSDTIKRTIENNCEKNICKIPDLPPLEYKITISKEWYKDYVSNIKISRNSEKKFSFILKKQSFLKEISEIVKENTWSTNKIEELRNLWKIKDSYAYFDLKNNWIFYFENNNSNLTLYSYSSWTTNKLYDFEKVAKDSINLDKIYWNENEIFISIAWKIYIYNLENWVVNFFDFKIPVTYIKKIDNFWNYQIVSEKWSFLYSLNTEKAEYFSMFSDFVNYKDTSYIWVIFNNETERKNNYWINSNNNVIIYYDYISKEKKILLETEKNISKIIKENENIYFYDDENKKYLLEIWE